MSAKQDHIVEPNKMVASPAAMSADTAPAAMPGEIEHDPHDHSREYIPLPGGWEVQTKGAGSTYRLLDKKTGERFGILSGKDWMGLQAFFTRFAHEVFEASRDERKVLESRAIAAEAALAAERERCAKVVENHGQFFISPNGWTRPATQAELAAAIRAGDYAALKSKP